MISDQDIITVISRPFWREELEEQRIRFWEQLSRMSGDLSSLRGEVYDAIQMGIRLSDVCVVSTGKKKDLLDIYEQSEVFVSGQMRDLFNEYESLCERIQIWNKIQNGIDMLDAFSRDVVFRFYRDGFTWKEIANNLSISRRKITYVKKRAFFTIRNYVEQRLSAETLPMCRNE